MEALLSLRLRMSFSMYPSSVVRKEKDLNASELRKKRFKYSLTVIS